MFIELDGDKVSYLSMILVAGIGVLLMAAACSDDAQSGEGDPTPCPSGEVWNPVHSQCQPVRDQGDGGSGGVDSGPGEPDVNEGTADVVAPPPDGGDETDVPCVGPGCVTDQCPNGFASTSISGRVTIPSGALPLPDVAVFIPTAALEPIVDGASCERCDDQLSGSPTVHALTDINGQFRLMNVPIGEEITLVIQVGKWRRTVTVPPVEPCVDNPITNEDLTRLPRNRFEGDMPKIAVTTGAYDALECLLRKVGISASEITTHDGDGRVNLFAARGGTNRFVDVLHGGVAFPDAADWWDELDNLLSYDIVMHSCEGQSFPDDKSSEARQALHDFTEQGGRVFLSHWQNVWLRDGPPEFQAVANWQSGAGSHTGTGYFDTTFPKGQMLNDWMVSTGTLPAGQMSIRDVRRTVQSLDTNLAQSWIHLRESGNRPQYFSFNSPVHADEEEQCGRVIFSDIHIAAGDTSSPSRPFPSGCQSAELTPQEKALVFMFFDLSRCIIPDYKKE